MRPTPRGIAVVGVAVGAVAMALAFGARSLNALVVPALVALLAAVVQLRWLDRPTLDRTPPADDFVGETGTATLRFETDDPVFASVTERVAVGSREDGGSQEHTVETTVGGDPITVPVSFDARGEGVVGPTTVTARDVLGLLETTFDYTGTDSFLAYPPVRPLSDTAWHELSAMRDAGETPDRDEFDSLREYDRGDALRDIHWKTSAKRDDLIVKQFVADEDDDAVVLAAGGDPADADLLAEATASLAVALSEAGVPVHLVLPETTVESGLGGDQRVRMLEALARTAGGDRPEVDADVTVDAEGGRATIRVGTTETTFERLVGTATDDVVRGIAAVGGDGRSSGGASTGSAGEPDPRPTAADGGVDR
ncbi:DUF58 domain-containing protein [Salinirubrum litoreum]|uniref:DUF58 domain-containing protein n=1 Tax=Salinirubrum litoreum TaxID=1126234 RepID=A0ABD5RE33_9EURY|nr:DUF58 domain-containing protein [Salinirubrum litoreum]